MSSPSSSTIVGFARRLRFPTLFFVTLGLWLFTLVVPDPIPFVDEVLFGLATLLLANWKSRKSAAPTPPEPGRVIDGESRRE